MKRDTTASSLDVDGSHLAALMAYLFFVPCVLLSSTHTWVVVFMGILGGITLVAELYHLVETRMPARTLQAATKLMQDVVLVARLLATTLVPMLLATFGGGSCVFVVKLQPRALDCRVEQLGALATQSYAAFTCADGYVAVEQQLGVPAWDEYSWDRRLSEDLGADDKEDAEQDHQWTVGKSADNRYGYVAPIFRSREAFQQAEGPVAWAVQAGSLVERPFCGSLTGICGFFARTLRQDWSDLSVPNFYGEAWGYNITHFSKARMLEAVRQIRTREGLSASSVAGADQTFVTVGTASLYFGIANTALYVMATLLGVGVLDRLVAVLDSSVPHIASEPESSGEYMGLTMLHEPPSEEPAGLWGQANELWNDPLNTASLQDPQCGAVATGSLAGPAHRRFGARSFA